MFLRFVPEQSLDCHSTRIRVIHSQKSRGGVHKSVSNTLYPILCFVLKWALKERDRLNHTNVVLSVPDGATASFLLELISIAYQMLK